MAVSTITITFGDQAEIHAGMATNGTLAPQGLTLDDFKAAQKAFKEQGCDSEILTIEPCHKNANPAYIFLARGGLRVLCPDQKNPDQELHSEILSVEPDKQARMYGRIVNKHARWNWCFGDNDVEANLSVGQGSVVSFDRMPMMREIRERIPIFFGEKCRGLQAEGNYYYDHRKCGIGFHGDAERRIVVAVRTGAPMLLVYRWYFGFKPVGEEAMRINLMPGDVYAMCEEATGHSFKKSSRYCLRHAAGPDGSKFLIPKKSK